MSERKYSVQEIDRMRNAVRRQFPMSYGGPIGMPMKLTTEYDSQVEDRLRTYMLNGTEPEELDGGKPIGLGIFDGWTSDDSEGPQASGASQPPN